MAENNQSGHLLSHGLMARYGAPNIFLSLVAFPLAVHLPTFYSKYHALDFALVGIIIALSRLTDVFTDPLIGMWSDKTRTRIGRRKPFILVGVPLYLAAIWLLFVPIEGLVGPAYLFICVAALYLAHTLTDLPYKAWGAELTPNYSERSRVTGWREGFGLGGLVLALVIPLAMVLVGFEDLPSWMLGMAIISVIGLPILFFVTLVTIKEPTPEALADAQQMKWLEGLKIVFRNPHFTKLLWASILLVTSGTMTATLGFPFITTVLGVPEADYPYYILAYYAGSTIAIPFWLRLSDKIGKHKAITIAVAWLSLWSLPIPFLLEAPIGWFILCMMMKGSTVGALALLPPSMAADVVDYDTVQSGEQRSGLYFSLWGMIYKASVAVGVVLATSITASVGFSPANEFHDDTTRFVVAFCYSLGPALIALIAVPTIWRFRITKQVQEDLRRDIEARKMAVST
ncbi:MAG: MFS transporter [Alphaproteobacteria bacterium]